VTQEVRLFLRMSAFGLIVGAAYWFLTYETAGTVLLVGFGIAAGIAAVAVFVGGRAADRRAPGAAGSGSERTADRGTSQEPAAEDTPLGAPPKADRAEVTAPPSRSQLARPPDVEPIPRPGWAPVGLAIGLGAVFLGGAFGPFPAIGGVVVTIVSAWSWLSSAMNETDAARAAEATATAPDPQPDRGVSSPRS
jgi:hypothetical protein